MRAGQMTDEQTVAILQEAGTLRVPGDKMLAALCKEKGISENTFYTGHPHSVGGKKFGAMQTSDVKRLRGLKIENARLKRLLAGCPCLHGW